MAMAEVLVIGPDEALTPEQVAAGIDDYLYSFTRAREVEVASSRFSALTVYPLFRLRPPFALMSPDRRLAFIERCFITDVVERRLPGPLRKVSPAMLFAAQQLAIIGYYADPRTASSTGYVPFSKRKRYEKAIKKVGKLATLDVSEPNEVDAERITADVAIVGSGAAGSVLAYRLAEAGREVVVLEGGKHVDPRDFTEDERVQFSNLFARRRPADVDGHSLPGAAGEMRRRQHRGQQRGLLRHPAAHPAALERPGRPGCRHSTKPAFRSRSSSCASGFPSTARRTTSTSRWAATRWPRASEPSASTAPAAWSTPTSRTASARATATSAVPTARSSRRSTTSCPGRSGTSRGPCGSSASAWRRRSSTSGSEPPRCVAGSPTAGRSGLRPTRSSSPAVRWRRACCSSAAISAETRAGTGLSFNVGAPLTAEFEEKLNSFDGLQISHGYRPTGEDQLILESWFNPVGTQALLMPGWFSDHFHNMRRYAHLSCIGVVVGIAEQRQHQSWLPRQGDEARLRAGGSDLKLLLKGTKLAARIHFASGALRVMPMTFRRRSYTSPNRSTSSTRSSGTTPTSGSTPPIRRAATPSAGIPRRVSSTSAFASTGGERLRLRRQRLPLVGDRQPAAHRHGLADYAAAGIE